MVAHWYTELSQSATKKMIPQNSPKPDTEAEIKPLDLTLTAEEAVNSDSKKDIADQQEAEPEKKPLSRNDLKRAGVMFLLLVILGGYIWFKSLSSLIDVIFLVTVVNSINQAILDFFENKETKAYLSAITRGLAVGVLVIVYIVSKFT